MTATHSGSLRLFRFRGVHVFVHFSWFLAAWYIISTRGRAYSSIGWQAAEYVGLFGIVLLHEFGHVFACRQVGGDADEIVLWPLGGIAFVKPPPRAKAELWTIAAGPLVNVVLYPVLYFATQWCAGSGIGGRIPDAPTLLHRLWEMNGWLLLFNLMPIYPLDGGQILRSLLWLKIGRARSLYAATAVGFLGIAAWVAFRLSQPRADYVWTLAMGGFVAFECYAGFRHARVLLALDRMPAHSEFACPNCRSSPPAADLWLCERCGHRSDAFWTRGVCPHCNHLRTAIRCPHCGEKHSLETWEGSAPAKARD
jgi:Zn-dependent protease